MFAERAGFKNSNQEVPRLLLLNTEVLGVSFITLLLETNPCNFLPSYSSKVIFCLDATCGLLFW